MPDFAFVQSPSFSPTRCAACSTHSCDEGFIDLVCSTATAGFTDGFAAPSRADEPKYGRLYLCARCVWTAARMVGCLDPLQAHEARERTAAAEGRANMLESELADERGKSKMLNLDDLRALQAEIAAKDAKKPKATA